MHERWTTSRAIAATLLLATVLLAARCPVPGQTWFASADRLQGFGQFGPVLLAGVDAALLAVADTTTTASAARDVVEGDIFRILSPGLLLNLNPFRGLQVIDVRDVTHPRIIGRVSVSGTPVELQVIGDIAYMILNGGSGLGLYDDSSSSAQSMVLAVDVSDPSEPLVIRAETVPGHVQTSRLTRDGNRAALYVVSMDSAFGIETPGQTGTHVRSFDVSEGQLTFADGLDLGGAVTAVQASPEVLMVARSAAAFGAFAATSVALIDIRDPAGVLVPGDEVTVAGVVQNQFNMDYHEGILRVVSGSGWWAGAAGGNHLETFDASDLSEIVPVDVEAFGAGESLFATLFLGKRAFAVTYRRVDPFHAFEISDEGLITVGAEFEVSGWNDFFRPAFDDTRLLGVGIDDNTLAVSLYDVGDITNPQPLLARASVGTAYGSSAANVDHRAFSVLEDAVSVPGPNGVVETGLVLLPFSTWDSNTGEPIADVQIFTFSDHTLTRRGAMPHRTPVQRSFAAGDAIVANLSDEELSLFDTESPDAPAELGRVALAPDYTDVYRFGEHRVRIVNGNQGGFAFGVGGGWTLPTAVEVVSAAADPDLAEPVARFEVSARAVLHRTGPYLVSVVFDPDARGTPSESEIIVFDLSDPTHPQKAGQLRTDRLRQASGLPWLAFDRAMPACLGCFAPWPSAVSQVAAAPDALVFLQGGFGQPSTVDVLDLGEPTTPRFAASIALDAGLEGSGLLVVGHDAWVSLKYASRPDRRGRAFSRHFVNRIDVSNPSAPAVGARINVPGDLFAVSGSEIFTRDLQWEAGVLESGIVRLALEVDHARALAVRWFPGRDLAKVELDGAGNVLVMHGPERSGIAITGLVVPSFAMPIPMPIAAPEQVLSVLDADSLDLALLSESKIGSAASLLGSIPGRALFQVPGGLLVLDLDDPASPHQQAFFATRTSIDRIAIDGRSAFFAGGRFGIQSFDLDASNQP